MLWDWPAKLYDESDAATDADYSVFGKAAEPVIKAAYATATRRRS